MLLMGTVHGFDFQSPTKGSALKVLTQAFEPERALALWAQACQLAAIPDGEDESETSLTAIFHQLSQMEGAVSVYGLSLKVRLITYRNLQKMESLKNK